MPARRILLFSIVAASLFLATSLASAGGRGEPGRAIPVQILLGDEEEDLRLFHMLDLDVDGVFDGWARAFVIDEELTKLRKLGYSVTELPDEGRIGLARMKQEGVASGRVERTIPAAYHTYETLSSELAQIAADHPAIVRLITIGRSNLGRELWMVKITRNPDLEEDEPEVLYVSSMHGDEVVGKELCVGLIHHLTDNYGIDSRVTQLVDTTEIWIMPSMNPDGTALGQRWNSNNVDLNRNFPDQFTNPNDVTTGRERETRAVMDWRASQRIDLSSNFHGGAVVANYPWDSNPQNSPVYSASPDDSLFVSLARTYASANTAMATSNSHSAFDNGITNGADWYPIYGGMQDWGYIWRGGLEVLMELSQSKWPPASQLPGFWTQNLESLLRYFERVHEGVRGRVTDATSGAPLAATVTLLGNPAPTYTDPSVGDYHRPLLPGTYAFDVSALGYSTRRVSVDVRPGLAAVRDVALVPLGVALEPTAICASGVAGCDPWLAPGATTNLAVTLRNFGLPATNVSAQIVPTGWQAQITRSDAAYPDLASGASGQSASPHHGVALASNAPAGHKVGFALRWATSQGQGESQPIFLPVGGASCQTVASSQVPRTIADHQTAQSALTFPTRFEISEVRVALNVLHTYIGELRVEVVSPSGTPIALHNRTGGSADNIVGTYGAGLTSYEPLSRIHGEASDGNWQLRVHDAVNGDTGSIQSWSVTLCGRPFEVAPPEMRLREMSVGPGGSVRLDWWPYPGLTSYRVYRSLGDPSTPSAFVNVTAEDPDPSNTTFVDTSSAPLVFWLVTGVGPNGEGPRGHFGQ